ncbi:phage tail tape measure protein [Parabacteroides distasonis]|uniref:phage tail tape measure protein n=1 Tax=Parabacteroides distasonis TaxID=823 RepID=UPI00189B0261|nr:phage tail tape measure protein [Parabacteroides distasonis]MDB9146537.1 phage tail tape measure protein [Parabacteroides distasonis]
MAGDLNRSIKIYLDNSDAMTSASELETKIGELEKKLLDLRTAGEGNSKAAKKIERELTAQTQKMQKYKQEVADTERVLKNLSGATYKELLDVKGKISSELKKTTRNTTEYNSKLEMLKRVSKETALVQKEMRVEIGCQASSWGRAADWLNKYMGIIGSGVAAITGITMAFSKFRDERDKLESSSANLKALTGLDDENVAKLENAAKRLSTTVTKEGVRIKQSAVEIDDSFAIIGSQRPELLKNAEALEKVTQDAIYLSIAGKDKLEPAAKALTTVMNQMNLGADQSRRIINAIAAGSQAGAANIQYITDAFEKSGTTANLMNLQLEQHIGLIEAVAPKYSEAAVAGNSLDKVLLRMKEKNIGYKNGVFDLSLAINEIAVRFKKGESAAKLFGEEHAKMAEILVMNKADIERYTTAVTDTNKAVEQAQTNSDTNEAKRAQARNKMNLLAMDLMEKLNPAIIGAMNQTVHWTGKLVALATWISENTTEILAIITGLTAYTIAVKSSIIADQLKVIWNEKIITSMKSLYATMLKNPYALMGAVVLTWLLYMKKANQELTKMDAIQRRLNKVESDAAQNITQQKTELEQFLRLARDESETKERRLSAIKKLNEISPEYLGNLTLEEIGTDKATTAINKYIDSIYEMAKAQAAKEQLIEIEKEKIRLDTDPEAFQEQIPWLEQMEVGLFGLFSKDKADKMLADMVARGRIRRDKTKTSLEEQAEALRKIIASNSKTVNEILSGNNSTTGGSSNRTLEDTEFKSAMDLKLKEMETAHASELALLKKQKSENEQTEQFYNLSVISSDVVYYQKRIDKLQEFLKKAGSDKIKAEINKQIVEAQTKLLDIETKRENEVISALQDNRNKRLKIEEQCYITQKTELEKAVAKQAITEEQSKALLLSIETHYADKRLTIQKDYQNDVFSLEIKNGSTKAKAIEEANNTVLDADLKAAQARASQQKALQNLLKDFKGQFNLTTVGEETELQIKVLDSVYKAKKEMAKKDGLDMTELDAAYERAKTNIVRQEEDKRYQIRSQYGLVSMKEQYEKDMKTLKEQYRQGLLNEKEYQQAKLKIKTDYLKKSVDTYSNMFSGTISALQEAEIANIDAKYDLEIQRAGDNADEVTRLEKEKETKKLEIQKKYADVQFAIKVSEIIANTAVAIMQAFAQLGPIGGAIAAAMLTVTGAAQIAIANAERKKIKNMTSGGNSSSGSSSGARVASTSGYYNGGFTGNGGILEVAGPVHREEYVTPAWQLQDPVSMNHILALDAIQRQRTSTNPLPVNGFANGGYNGRSDEENVMVSSNNPELLKVLTQLLMLFSELRAKGMRAYIVYSDIEAAQKTLNKSKKIGGK